MYITYPANFNKKKQEIIKLTAQKAGFLNVELIDEPTAAAYCYCDKGKIKEGDILLVYDLGGGTFDVALIQYISGQFKHVTHSLGIDKCGGMDIDTMIFNDIYSNIPEEMKESMAGNDMAIKRVRTSIYELSVEAKYQLSTIDMYNTAIPIGFESFDYEISRDRLNDMIATLVEETLIQVGNIVQSANIKMSDVDTILTVGGSSRIPYIKDKLKEITGKEANRDIDPELAICIGAALWEVNQEKTKDIRNKQEDKPEIIESSVIERKDKYVVLQGNNNDNKTLRYDNQTEFNKNTRDNSDRRNEEKVEKAEEEYRLGCNYLNGENGLQQDYRQAISWLKKSAEKGNADAQKRLGSCYYIGDGVKKNYKIAVHWYSQAKKMGHAGAEFMLGVCYYDGSGIDQDRNKAVKLWENAAKKGHNGAIAKLKSIKEESNNIESNKVENLWSQRFTSLKNQDEIKSEYLDELWSQLERAISNNQLEKADKISIKILKKCASVTNFKSMSNANRIPKETLKRMHLLWKSKKSTGLKSRRWFYGTDKGLTQYKSFFSSSTFLTQRLKDVGY